MATVQAGLGKFGFNTKRSSQIGLALIGVEPWAWVLKRERSKGIKKFCVALFFMLGIDIFAWIR